MLINEKIVELLQNRINEEENSSRLYLAMSQWLSYNGFIGAAALWKKYSQEELIHAQWTYNYLQERDIMPETRHLLGYKDFQSFPEIIKMSYNHELKITKSINELGQACLESNDLVTLQLVNKYLVEQAEEEGKILTFLDRIDAFGQDPIALRLLDNEMAKMA